jgi:hypothetical protein
MLSPEFQYMIHKQKERELEAQIEHIRLARENWQVAYRQRYPDLSLVARVRQWLNGKLPRLAPQRAACAEEPQLCAERA